MQYLADLKAAEEAAAAKAAAEATATPTTAVETVTIPVVDPEEPASTETPDAPEDEPA